MFVTKLNVQGNELVYSTYIGGDYSDIGQSIAVDDAGCAYITGATTGYYNFPIKNAYQDYYGGGGSDGFVTKFNTHGNALVYSTYLGGSDSEHGFGVVVDASGNAYITGQTRSDDFPVKNAYQSIYGGYQEDGFVTKLNAYGDGVFYSTYLGGSRNEYGQCIAVDSGGKAYITGVTDSPDFPTKNAYQGSLGSPFVEDAFVTCISHDPVKVPGWLDNLEDELEIQGRHHIKGREERTFQNKE